MQTLGGDMADFELILQELRGFCQENKEQLETIKEDILKANTRLNEAEQRIEKAGERIQNTEEVMTEMLKLHVKLEDKLMDLESRSRRENVRIYGVQEGSEKEASTMVTFVENLLQEGLGLTEDVPDLQIERAHRSVGPQLPDDAPPRSIIVKFLSFKTKERLHPQGMAEEGIYLARKPNKPGPRLSTAHPQKAKRIRRGPQGSERKSNSIPDSLPGQATSET